MREYQTMVPDAPERIFRMAEVRTVDASRRLDKLVDAEIEQTKSDRNVTVVCLLVFTIASIVFFALGNNIAGGVMLGLPAIGLLKVMWTGSQGSSGAPKRDGKG